MPALFRRALKDFEISGRLIPKVMPLYAKPAAWQYAGMVTGATLPALGACCMLSVCRPMAVLHQQYIAPYLAHLLGSPCAAIPSMRSLSSQRID